MLDYFIEESNEESIFKNVEAYSMLYEDYIG